MVQARYWGQIDSHIRSLMRLMLPNEAETNGIVELLDHREYALALQFLAEAAMDEDTGQIDVEDCE